jgi:hypothetical protein
MPRGAHLKLTEAQRKRMSDLSRKYIAEEKATGKYPAKRAVAIGLNRARREIVGATKKAESKQTEIPGTEKNKEKGFLDWLFGDS